MITEDVQGKLDALYQASPLAIIALDMKGLIASWNPAAEKIFGWTERQVLGRPLPFVPGDKLAECERLMARALEGEAFSGIEVRRQKRNGEPIDISIFTAPLRDAFGRMTGAMAVIMDVTQSKQADDRLKRTVSLLQSTLDSTTDGLLVVDSGGKIVSFNRRFLEMWRIPPAVIEPHEDDLALDHALDQLVNPGDFLSKVRELYADPETQSFDVLEFKDGRVFERVSSPHRLADRTIGRVWSFRDVTDQRQAEAALKLSEKLYRALVDTVADAIFSMDVDGSIVFSNQAADKMFGYEPGELLGKDIVSIIPERYREAHLQGVKRYMDTHQAKLIGQTVCLKAIKKGGAEFPIELSLAVGEAGGSKLFTGVIRDITEQKTAESALENSFDRTRKTLEETVNTLASITEKKDPYTSGHQRRVGVIAVAIAEEMGLEKKVVDGLATASVLHDIGKIQVPAEILSKPSRLSQTEFSLIKTHAESGYEILKDIPFDRPVAEIVRQHHERLDGSGYPRGLEGDHILPEARILAVADVVEAIASFRPYRPALGVEKALAEISGRRGELYDTAAVDACLKLFEEKKLDLD